jgi:hypothetical protein
MHREISALLTAPYLESYNRVDVSTRWHHLDPTQDCRSPVIVAYLILWLLSSTEGQRTALPFFSVTVRFQAEVGSTSIFLPYQRGGKIKVKIRIHLRTLSLVWNVIVVGFDRIVPARSAEAGVF